MNLAMLIVTYELRVPVEEFHSAACEATADISGAPGLVWKIWGLDAKGEGTSAYLFGSVAEALAFADGDALQALRSGPARHVQTRIAPVAVELSQMTKATSALGLTDAICID